MNLPSSLWVVFAFVSLFGIGSLTYGLRQSIDESSFYAHKIEMVKEANPLRPSSFQKLSHVSDIDLDAYFKYVDNDWQYIGGLSDQWTYGNHYSLSTLRDQLSTLDNSIHKGGATVYSVAYQPQSIYVLLRSIDVSTPAEFLQSLDQYQETSFDTMVIDLRFIRLYEFPLYLRLLNQWSTYADMEIGEIYRPTGAQKMTTGGKPFFQAHSVIFLLSEDTPLPIIQGLKSLLTKKEYHWQGQMPEIPDTVCLFKGFKIQDQKYRICSEYFINSDTIKPPFSEKRFPVQTPEIYQSMVSVVDELFSSDVMNPNLDKLILTSNLLFSQKN